MNPYHAWAVGLAFIVSLVPWSSTGGTWLDLGEKQITPSGMQQRAPSACRIDTMKMASIAEPQGDLLATTAVLAAPNNRLAVVGALPNAVAWYSIDQRRRVFTTGRKGGGPGEFRFIEALGWSGDTLLLWDKRLRRITLVGPTGGVGRMISFDLGESASALAFDIRPMAVLKSGRLILAGHDGIPLSSQIGIRRDSVLLLVSALSSLVPKPLLRIPESEQLSMRVGGGLLSIVDRPLGARKLVATRSGSIVVNTDGSPDLRILDLAGKVTAIWRSGLSQSVATSVMSRRAISEAVDQIKGLPVELLDELRKEMGRSRTPTLLPVFDRLLVDEDDLVWVRESYPEARGLSLQVWHRFTKSGVQAGQLELPVGWHVWLFGRHRLVVGREHGDGTGRLLVVPLSCA